MKCLNKYVRFRYQKCLTSYFLSRVRDRGYENRDRRKITKDNAALLLSFSELFRLQNLYSGLAGHRVRYISAIFFYPSRILSRIL